MRYFLVMVMTASLLLAGSPAQATPETQPRGVQVKPRDGVVTDGRARFQVVTPTLIRMEYAAGADFEDRPTMTVPDRSRPGGLGAAPQFDTRVEGPWRIVRTAQVELRWRRGRDFSPANLRMTFRDGTKTRSVRPSPEAKHSYLGGWTRGLDLSSGREPLNNGILTREGWYVVDDSDTVLLTDEGPGFRVRPEREGAYHDWYAFAYGHNFKRALGDLRTLTGDTPLLPRNAFGVWFSKYFAYTEAEFRALVSRFEKEGVPLDTLSLDTDFKRQNDPIGSALATNVVGQPGRAFSWNGWDWNKDYFPDPDTFVDWAHRRDIALVANIHPSISSNAPEFDATNEAAGGLETSQDCRSLQADTTGECHVFDWTDERQLTAYFDLHDTLAATGIDAFWLDWCCEAQGAAEAPGLSADTWINSQYAAYNRGLGTRWTAPSRIGGEYRADGSYGDRSVGAGGTGALAEHRSAIHFTGDTCATWEMLGFQAEMTAAEAAIGMPYVTHDIGSFNGEPQQGQCNAVAAALAGAPVPDDLYVRWLQLGAFQPLDRLHSNHGERLPWEYEGRTRTAATKALRLRGELVPYTYTAARRATDTGLPIAGPLYLSWPRQQAAYRHPTQFTYGRDLVVAPVTSPGAQAAVRLWVPPGQWVERTTGRRLRGPAVTTIKVGLNRIPVLVRAGAVLPSHRTGERAGVAPTRRMVLTAYPGQRGRGELYDDAGDGFAYERGAHTRTSFSQRRRGGAVTVRIGRARGDFDQALRARTWDLTILDVERPRSVLVDGRRVRTWTYDAKADSVRVLLERVPSRGGATVRLVAPTT